MKNEHWAPHRLWLAVMKDDELQEKINWACEEDWDSLRDDGVDLADLSNYSTVHRLFFALEEQEIRTSMSAQERVDRISKLKELAGDRAY